MSKILFFKFKIYKFNETEADFDTILLIFLFMH